MGLAIFSLFRQFTSPTDPLYLKFSQSVQQIIIIIITQSADRIVSSFVDSSAQHRGNEAEPDSNGNKNFQSGPNVPCQSAQTDKSVSSA